MQRNAADGLFTKPSNLRQKKAVSALGAHGLKIVRNSINPRAQETLR
jgi:hypothetical protein